MRNRQQVHAGPPTWRSSHRPSTLAEQLAVTACGVVLAVLAEVALVMPTGFVDAAILLAGWVVLGGLLALISRHLLRRKVWWVHTAVMSALIVGAVLAGVAAAVVPSFGMQTLFALPLICTWIALLAACRARSLSIPGHCDVCEYNLFGLLHTRCPECGTASRALASVSTKVPTLSIPT